MSAHPDIFTLALDMLLRPRRYARFLAADRANITVSVATALLWCGVSLASVTIVLGQLIPLGTSGLIGALAYSVTFTLALTGPFLIIGGALLPSGIAFWYWLTRNLVAVTPIMAVLLGFGMSRAIERLPPIVEQTAIGLLLLLIGAMLGGGLTVMISLREAIREGPAVRWVLGIGFVALSLLLWLSAAVWQSNALFFAPVCLGMSIGAIRPLSWCGLALWSASLALAARFGAPALPLAQRHPLLNDELGLLPLPGAASLLARSCMTHIDEGVELLIITARHPAYGHVVDQTLRQIVRNGRQMHPVLFSLSMRSEGAALLADMVDRSTHLLPVIEAYAKLSNAPDQAAWRSIAVEARDRLGEYAMFPGGMALLSLLDAATGILSADRYAAALENLRRISPPQGVEADPLWNSLAMLLQAVRSELPLATVLDWQTTAVTVLDMLDGWPAALLAAMIEHMTFLIQHEPANHMQ